jgi:hypothetical protein
MSKRTQHRPFKWGPNDKREFITSCNEYSVRCQNDANGNCIYLGRAKVGTLTSEDKWQICYMTYDANNSLLTLTWPQDSDSNASSEFEFVWDSRAGYVYS